MSNPTDPSERAQDIAYHRNVQIAIDAVINAVGIATEDYGIKHRIYSRITQGMRDAITEAIRIQAENGLRRDRHE